MNEMTFKNWIIEQVNLNYELLNRTELLAKTVLKQKKQIKKIRHRNVMFGLFTATAGYLLSCVVVEQGKKIDKLTAEIEELRKEELAQEGE